VTFKARKAEPGNTKLLLPTSDIVTGIYPGKVREPKTTTRDSHCSQQALSAERHGCTRGGGCRAQGRVAQANFKDPKWVDGVLLSIDRTQAARRLAELNLTRAQGAAGAKKRLPMELQLEAFASADLSFVWHLKGQRSMVLFSRQPTSPNAPQ
jgi:hypothetical protein